jgi:DNA-binding NarL/FixJ family response regulator
MKKITVLIADDHAIVREGLRLILETFEDIAVVGEAADGQQALREAQRVRPDVVLMDLSMPLLNGVEATRQIIRERPGTKVIVLSTYSDDEHVQQAVEAGAAGYLMKETASKDLLRAIHEARKGNAFFSPAIAMRLLKQCRNRHSESKTAAARELSSRQKEVVQLIAEGYSSNAIAGLLCVATKTVEKHRQTVMKKLDIHNIAALTRYAVSSGIVDSNYVPIARSQHARSSRFDVQQKPALSPTELAA